MDGNLSGGDTAFAGSIPEVYERFMGPMIFEPYAGHLAARVDDLKPRRVLEVAAGTGILTRALARRLARDVALVATDLNEAMLKEAARIGTPRPVEWRQADALHLPFPDASFDVVACQFGVMFFPDKVQAFSQAWRVLRPGGHFVFNTWDRLERNAFASGVTRALEDLFPDAPPRFMARVPHGYHDPDRIAEDLRHAGFTKTPHLALRQEVSHADSPRMPAVAFCQGTPLRHELEPRGVALVDITDVVTEALAREFGNGSIRGEMNAFVVHVEK
ncbi:class I SAM-dependent methyltransferase [Deinococcus yavapaiensis]|uniref:Ubiquinone/menaquinone biosynthesis C-methylase UbiE n=1 Tax=Deinococcus yavapaiensis KR-236 TaxID=694435 RepID=A0A318SRG5_9DEIO|nr:methyltransferase domain-containing protein [Deinococcus yavapaiensis]PYE55667.1 ubiquinone/menaquinone biosynthesis C-methylase UbiE [Deinococcus yavapaiensis KR-236]